MKRRVRTRKSREIAAITEVNVTRNEAWMLGLLRDLPGDDARWVELIAHGLSCPHIAALTAADRRAAALAQANETLPASPVPKYTPKQVLEARELVARFPALFDDRRSPACLFPRPRPHLRLAWSAREAQP